ncbi:MAG TPA: protein-L-isoaspartate O-methyltransferase [Acidobacteria bacterium]|nr:protein-L-isoaspartate O-methyltransferase [Acidobacteriota bacterium]HAK57010.1 protein-L-isoaspartate O-methyltransferase [Acidobacteriota bacterium]
MPVIVTACAAGGASGTAAPPPGADAQPDWDAQRARMVETQLRGRDIADPTVLDAMRRVPRHLLVPEAVRELAYNDHPVPIGYEQTISQPYIVAYMTQLLDLPPNARVLEIGTGSGYQAAVLSEIAAEVYTIEIVEELAARAAADLTALGYDNVTAKAGDGYVGWPEQAPFDGIMVTAAPDHVPQPLVDQLAVGARLVLPVGRDFQVMTVITRTAAGVTEEQTIPVRFVPMTGRARVPGDD